MAPEFGHDFVMTYRGCLDKPGVNIPSTEDGCLLASPTFQDPFRDGDTRAIVEDCWCAGLGRFVTKFKLSEYLGLLLR